MGKLLITGIFCILFIAACSEGNEYIATTDIDPDGIALENNWKDGTLSEREDIYYLSGIIDRNGIFIEQEITEGIINKRWKLSEDCQKLFITELKKQFADYTYGLSPPCYVYIAGDVVYGGSFSLNKTDKEFQITTTVDKKYIENTWQTIPKQNETHSYFVDTYRLAFD